MHKFLLMIGVGLSFIGLYGVFKISNLHFLDQNDCPMIGLVPACYVILASYSFMLLSWLGCLFLKCNTTIRIIFWLGFMPTFLLALLGSMGEVFGFARCPRTESGFPMCFISLALVVLILIVWILYSRKHRS